MTWYVVSQLVVAFLMLAFGIWAFWLMWQYPHNRSQNDCKRQDDDQ